MQRLEADQMLNPARKTYAQSFLSLSQLFIEHKDFWQGDIYTLHFRCLEVIEETIWLLIKIVDTSNLKNDDCKIIFSLLHWSLPYSELKNKGRVII